MEFLVLTKVGGILGPFATVLGIIMDWLFKLTSIFGIQNIGLCIILFTLVTKLLMFPLTLKQQKSSKLMSIMQPELNAIQAKYKGKSDQESMMKQNVEIHGSPPSAALLVLHGDNQFSYECRQLIAAAVCKNRSVSLRRTGGRVFFLKGGNEISRAGSRTAGSLTAGL